MYKKTASESRTFYISGIILLSLIVGILVAGYLNYRSYGTRFRKEVENQLSAITKLKVAEIVQWRSERLANAQTISNNPVFSELVRRALQKPVDAEAQRILKLWLKTLLVSPSYTQIFLLDTQGVLQLSTLQNDQIFTPHFSLGAIEALSLGKIQICDLSHGARDENFYMDIVIPIFDPQNSRLLLGSVILRIDPGIYLYPLLKHWPTSSSTAETLLIRRDGSDALFLNELKYRKDAALKLRISLTQVQISAVQAALGHEGIVEGIDYRGVPVIAYVRKVPDSPWFMVARMDTEEVYAPLKERQWIIIVLFLALFLSLGFGILQVWRQQKLIIVRRELLLRKQAEKQLNEKNTELQLLFKSMINAFVLFESVFDDAGRFVSYRFVEINEAYERITGVTSAEVRGKTVHEVWPETEPEWISRYGEVAVTGVSQVFDLYHGPTKKTYYCNVYRPGDSQKRFCVIFNDVTEIKQAEKMISMQAKISKIFLTIDDEKMYSHVLKIILEILESPFGVFGYIDQDGALVVPTMTRSIWEKCQVHDKVIRFPRNTWGDSSWPRAIREKKLNFSNEPSSKIPDGHVAIRRHITVPIIIDNTVVGLFQIANKKTDYNDNDIKILQNIAGHIAPILNARIARDLHEKNLHKRNDELASFSYAISHDLKSPLVTIRSFVGFLEKDFQNQDTDRIAKDFIFIRSACEKMSRLLDELLDMTRVGYHENIESSISLQDIVHEALTLVGGRIAERGVIVEVTAQPLMFCGDRIRLVEVFQNLVDNAVKFMGEQSEPHIDIGWKRKGNEDILFVRDNGMGIDPRYKGKVFDLFEKIESAFEGTGIGLALVKRIVEVHNGRIWVESEGLGKGSCFWFTLPGKRGGRKESFESGVGRGARFRENSTDS